MAFDRLKSMFRQDHKTQPLASDDAAWSEPSVIYAKADFEKYNPDDLIGLKGYRIYRKMMNDEQVKAVVKFKRDAVTSRDFVFELDHERYGISEDEAKRRIDLSYEIIDKMRGSWMDALNGVMSAIYNGFSMTEKIFGQFEHDGLTWWGVDKLKLKPYDTFFFHVDEYGNIESLVQKLAGVEKTLDVDKFIHYVVNPDVDEHYGGSELREAYRAWFSKDVIIKFRNMWLERHAGGFIWVQAKDGKTLAVGSQEYNDLKKVMSNIQTSTGIIIPGSLELHTEYPTNNVAYKEAIDDYDTAIARAMLVPNLLGVSPQGNVGSYSQSTNQLEAFLWTLEADATRLEEALNEQLFRQLGAVNFGDDAWPRYKFKPPSGEKKLNIIKTWQELVNAGAVQPSDTDEEHLRDMLEFPDVGEVTTHPVPSEQPSVPSQQPSPDTGSENDDPLEDNEDSVDSTVVGKGLVSVSSFSKAMRRVDFAVIAKTSDSVTDEYTAKTAELMDTVIRDLVDKAKAEGSVSDDVSKNVRAVKVDGKLKRKINSIQNAMLKEGFSIGTKHASFEVDKAKKTSFSRQVDMERVNMIAEDYFRTTAFKITGDLTDEATKTIEQIILNGAKYDKAWSEIEKDIYQSFATKGMISLEQAKDALGEALNVTSPDARIRTITRTSTFDAINVARHAYFTDPGLEGFVVAYEYSAILDSRTTQICRHLDDENRGNHSLDWYNQNAEFRPPNHFNCRSVLVPVTEVDQDDYVEGDEPSMFPQEGFR